jgi:transposase-like protein
MKPSVKLLPASSEVIDKVSSKKGVPLTKEHKKKISDAMLAKFRKSHLRVKFCPFCKSENIKVAEDNLRVCVSCVKVYRVEVLQN